jgi:hypothetical protein
MSVVRSEYQIWGALVTGVTDGLAGLGYAGVDVLQSYQPTIQGAASTGTVYLHRIGGRRLQTQGKRYYQTGEFPATGQIYRREQWQKLESFQANAVVREEPGDLVNYTCLDLVSACLTVVQSQSFIDYMLENGITLNFPTEIRQDYFVQEDGSYDKDPSFDFSLMFSEYVDYAVDPADVEGEVETV